MPYNRWAKFTIGGQTYEHVTFINGIGHEPADTTFTIDEPDNGVHYAPHERPAVEPERDSWSVELPIVLWMLDQVKRGHLTPAQMRKLLVDATAPRSGCCYACDDVRIPEDELLADLSRERQEWIEWWNSLTPQTHPYLLSGSKIHRWDCHTVAHAQPEPPPVYRSKHEYATRNHRPLNQEVFGHYRRATADEAHEWLYQFRRRTYPPRCKVCAPELPGSWRGEASDVPSTH